MPANPQRYLRFLGALNQVPQPTYPRVWCWAVGTGLALAALELAIGGRHAVGVISFPPIWTLVQGTFGSFLLQIKRQAGARAWPNGQDASPADDNGGLPPQPQGYR